VIKPVKLSERFDPVNYASPVRSSDNNASYEFYASTKEQKTPVRESVHKRALAEACGPRQTNNETLPLVLSVHRHESHVEYNKATSSPCEPPPPPRPVTQKKKEEHDVKKKTKTETEVVVVSTPKVNSLMLKAYEIFKRRSVITGKLETCSIIMNIVFVIAVIVGFWYVFHYSPVTLASQRDAYMTERENFLRAYTKRDDFASMWRSECEAKETSLNKEALEFEQNLSICRDSRNIDVSNNCNDLSRNISMKYEKRRKELRMSANEIKERIPFSLTDDQKDVWNRVESLYSSRFGEDLYAARQYVLESTKAQDPLFIMNGILENVNVFIENLSWKGFILLCAVAFTCVMFSVTPALVVIQDILIILYFGLRNLYEFLSCSCCKRS